MKVNIHNQCSDLRLTDRGYSSTGAEWNECPDWEVGTGNVARADLIPFLPSFGGILTYELQRRYDRFGNQTKPKYIRLFVAWEYESYKKFRVFIHLIEYNKHIKWNLSKLEEYYQKHASQLSTYTGPIKDAWLIDDDIVLMTGLELDLTQRGGILNITISEGVEDEHTRRPVWFNPKM
jgi:hypothetical protein